MSLSAPDWAPMTIAQNLRNPRPVNNLRQKHLRAEDRKMLIERD
jgi:hypothetical protein